MGNIVYVRSHVDSLAIHTIKHVSSSSSRNSTYGLHTHSTPYVHRTWRYFFQLPVSFALASCEWATLFASRSPPSSEFFSLSFPATIVAHFSYLLRIMLIIIICSGWAHFFVCSLSLHSIITGDWKRLCMCGCLCRHYTFAAGHFALNLIIRAKRSRNTACNKTTHYKMVQTKMNCVCVLFALLCHHHQRSSYFTFLFPSSAAANVINTIKIGIENTMESWKILRRWQRQPNRTKDWAIAFLLLPNRGYL